MKVFDDFIKNYDMNNKKIKLKYEHTYRVADLCNKLSDYLKLNEKDKNIAYLIGMFHDLGRFEQVRVYDSFDDVHTEDHGLLSSQIFIEQIVPKMELTDEEIQIINTSIINHNKFEYKESNTKVDMFCKIIRDADKIDIINIFASGYRCKEFNDVPSKTFNDSFLNRKTLKKDKIINSGDDYLLHLALIWDINYPWSLTKIKKEKYYEKLHKNSNEIYDKYFKEIENYLKEI